MFSAFLLLFIFYLLQIIRKLFVYIVFNLISYTYLVNMVNMLISNKYCKQGERAMHANLQACRYWYLVWFFNYPYTVDFHSSRVWIFGKGYNFIIPNTNIVKVIQKTTIVCKWDLQLCLCSFLHVCVQY